MDFTKIDIKPYQVGPLLMTPKTLALLFTGASAYISFVDPNARNSLEQTRQRLKHWAVMFNESKTPLQLLAAAAALSSVACYMKTKQNMWLVGGAMMALLFPYTALVLGSSTNYLLDNDKKLDPKIEMTSSEKFTVLQNLKSWVTLHAGKTIISLLAVGAFYLAELQSTDKIDGTLIIS